MGQQRSTATFRISLTTWLRAISFAVIDLSNKSSHRPVGHARHCDPRKTCACFNLHSLQRKLHILVHNQRHLPLAFLLTGDDLESTRVERGRLLLLLLLLLGTCAALLSNLRPAASCGFVLGWAGSIAIVDDALVGELTAAEELFSEMTGVECVACRVDGFGDELSIGRETQ